MVDLIEAEDPYQSKSRYSYADLRGCINAIPALFWRIEVVKNRIEFLNHYEIAGLGRKSNLLLQNLNFRKEVILEEDLKLFDTFMKSVSERQRADTVFRIKLNDGTLKWLRITGAPDPYRPTFYSGYIVDISDMLDLIRVLDKRGTSIGEKIALFDNPVVLFSFSSKKIYAMNRAFQESFGIDPEALDHLTIRDFLGENRNQSIDRIYEEIIFHHQWNGELEFRDNSGRIFVAETAIRTVAKEGKNLLWISIQPETTEDVSFSGYQDPSAGKGLLENDELLEMLRLSARQGDIMECLNVILKNQPDQNLADSILYSDIYIKEGKVITYGVGPSFESLRIGQEYPYEGTIAENIVKFKLDFIIVENTLRSIKPIDWALFIPRKVMSYYAKPIYSEDVLRTVLIFCSQKKSVFTEDNSRSYEPVFPLFREISAIWQNSK